MAQNPLNPQRMVMVWVTNSNPAQAGQPAPSSLAGAYTVNGGLTWNNFPALPGLVDPATDTPYPSAMEPSVAFDRFNNVYVVYALRRQGEQNRNDESGGAIVLRRFNFTGGAPVATPYAPGSPDEAGGGKIIYRWAHNAPATDVSDPAYNPAIVIDNTNPGFVDQTTGLPQGSPRSSINNQFSAIYVAWNARNEAPGTAPALARCPPGVPFNPNVIKVVASEDGGNTFSPPRHINDGENCGGTRYTTPSMVISQGRSNGTIPGGQVNIGYVAASSSVRFNTLPQGGVGFTFQGQGGTILDACAPVPPATDPSPRRNDFALPQLTLPAGFTATDVDIRLAVDHLSMDQVRIELFQGTPLAAACVANPPELPALVQNRVLANGNQRPGTPPPGITGTHLGILRNRPGANALFPAGWSGVVGTTFDEQAARRINDPNADNSRYASHFRPEFGQFNLTTLNLPAAVLNQQQWVLRIWDYRNDGQTPPPQALVRWEMRLAGRLTPGAEVIAALPVIATDPTRPHGGGPWQADTVRANMLYSPDRGVSPAISMASDNTLGSFSPYQGRLYITYTGGSTTNPNVFLAISDDGGASWATRQINDDLASDGFSEGNRAQFSPTVGVDNATGTLVISWYDGRHDAARTRVARYITTSIDGGLTLSPQTYANDAAAPVDAITRQAAVLGPVPENMGPQNPTRNLIFSFGDRQGMIVSEGRAILAWSGNGNVSGSSDLLLARVALPIGPRIVESTMGPVRRTVNNNEYTALRLADAAPLTYNNTFSATGIRQLDGFTVTFDRFVDIGTFTIDDVIVLYRSPSTAIGQPGEQVPVLAITPLFDERLAQEDARFGIDPSGQRTWCQTGHNFECGAKKFLITIAPQSRTGTYSYSVGPGIRDRIRGSGFVLPGGPTNTFTPPPGELNKPVPTNGTGGSGNPGDDITTSTVTVTGFAPGLVVSRVEVLLDSLPHTYVSDLVITLISPSGRRVVLSNQRGAGGQNYTNLIFADGGVNGPISGWAPPDQGEYSPDELLSAFLFEPPNGNWRLEINDVAPQDVGIIESWRLEVTASTLQGIFRDGNWMDQNGDGQRVELEGQLSITDAYAAPRPLNGTPFVAPYDLTTLPLLIPGPFVFSSNIPGRAPSQDNLLVDTGTPWFDIVFDRNMDPASITPEQILRMQGHQGVINGPFTITQIDARTFRLNFPTQTLAGTYQFTFGPGVRSVAGENLDTNFNAGLSTLRGFDPNGTTVVQTYDTAGPGVQIDANKTVSMPLVIPNLAPDTFLVQGVTLRLNISFPSNEAENLIGTLVHPDGTRVLLFDILREGLDTQDAFPDTVLDDTIDPPRTTSITVGTGPYRGTFNPQLPLSVLKNKLSTGTWRLEITNRSSTAVGIINDWSLNLLKPVLGTGLGELVADNGTASFRLWTWNGRNPVSRTQWQPMGPASVTEVLNGVTWTRSNRIAGIAVDPSDPSGNTVYVAGASGGLWKTNNFLSEDPLGPTYIPLTDFGPSLGINVGNVTVFGRNNDPRQSIIFLATGEGDDFACALEPGSTCLGVGLVRSLDGGQSWQLLDSTVNFDAQGNPLPLNDPRRDGQFLGNSSFKVIVDPRPAPSGDAVVYVAMSGPRGGIYRSNDSGNSWQLMRAGNATDIVFDENSAVTDAFGRPGNMQVLYAAFRGDGIYITPDRGTVWNRLDGTGGNPLLISASLGTPAPVAAAATPMRPRVAEDPVNGSSATSPNGANGRIVLAKPGLTGDALKDKLYEGWLYAAVMAPDGHLAGLYLTKDTGFNWTRIRLASSATQGPFPLRGGYVNGVAPTNDGAPREQPEPHLADFSNLSPNNQGNYDVSLTVDPNNPNVIYYGGLGMVRIDTTGISDPHAYFLSNDRNEGTRENPQGRLRCASVPPTVAAADPIVAQQAGVVPNPCVGTPNPVVPYYPEVTPFLNLHHDPNNPFVANSTVVLGNLFQWTNTGVAARWTLFEDQMGGAVDHHRIIAVKDQLTGKTRLIFGADQGLYTAIDDGTGRYFRSIGNVPNTSIVGGNVRIPFGSRNGNLQIAQLYAGAAQPSVAAAQINSRVRGMFYTVQQDSGFPTSTTGILDPTDPNYGNIRYLPPAFGDGTDVATDQQGFGTVYHTKWPCCGGGGTNFFQVDTIGRTQGLLQLPNDPQWPSGPSSRFALNPIDSRQIVMSSQAGRIFATYDQGIRWLVIGNPANLDSTYAQALAWGAPRPGDPFGARNNFIYAGTVGGRIFVTFTGGGGQGNQWLPLSAGLDGSPVMAITTNINRGSNEAYAVTQRGVYHMADSRAVGATWRNITGNLFQLTHTVFMNSSQVDTVLRYATTIAADWRYVLPDTAGGPPTADPARTHPVLYVGGEGGVYRSFDDGQTWTLFPNVGFDGAGREGGYLPIAQISDMEIALGRINQTDGYPEMARAGTDMLMVTTYGRGIFAIRLAPMIFPQTVQLSATLPNDGPGNVGSDRGLSSTDRITNVIRPVFEGLTEASQARVGGNRVRVFLFDVTNPANRRLIGTTEADEFGRFAVQVDAGVYAADGSTDGVKQLELYAEDSDDVRGNIAQFSFELRSGTPPLPGVPDLLDATDSGFFNNDNYTNVRTPVFFGTGTPGMAVRIFANGNLAGQGLVDGAGNYAVATSPLPDGTYTITARQLDLAGNISPFTAPLQPLLVIDTLAPAAPAFVLDPGSDSGISNTDHVTNVARPAFTGTGEPLAVATLLIDNVASGGTTVSPVGTFTAIPTGNIVDGTHSVQLQLRDLAGNVGPISGLLQPPLVIDTLAPRTPSTPQLSQSSRTGQGNTTRFSTPTFVGSGEPNIFMQILANGTLVGQNRVSSAGDYAVTTGPLVDGVYNVTGRLMDVAGNLSPESAALQPPLVVDSGVGRPTLQLTPSQVIGGTGANDVITPFVPQTFEGTAEIGTTVVLKDPNTGKVYDTFAQNGSSIFWTRNLNLVDGSYLLVAEVTDAAGNVSRSDVLTVTVNRAALDADRRFIRALYVDALGRSGTIAEWDIWVPHLRQPNGRFVVANAIERTREARTVLIKTWYETYLGRAASGGEEQGLVTALTQGFTEEQVIAAILGSDEYFQRTPLIAGFAGQPTNATFITALYIQILGRRPAPAEVTAWEQVLPNVLRGGVALGFLSSAEFRGNNVAQFYRELLDRPTPPTAAETNSWVFSGIDLTSMRVLFKSSPEYFFRQTGFLP